MTAKCCFLLLIIGLLLLDLPVINGAQVSVVSEGKAEAVIVIAREPSEAARSGATYLGDHIYQITGTKLEVVREISDLSEDKRTRKPG